MSFTPVVRYRNFTLNNLKAILEIYPDLISKVDKSEAYDFIESKLKGYKRTAYQYACQLGLEDRSVSYFKTHDYLYSFDDENLIKYLEFWLKTYFAPNPYVKSDDKPIIIYEEIAKQILSDPNYEISYEEFFSKYIGGASTDILINAITSLGNPIKVRVEGTGNMLYIEKKDKEELENIVVLLEEGFQVPSENDRHNFFLRFSYENFCKFYHIKPVVFEQNEVEITAPSIHIARNRLIYGAPGTGKSYLLEFDRKSYFNKKFERVTFYSDYSYGQFVGTYKPVSKDGVIDYKFVPGPFLRILIKALKNTDENYLIIIEEINRANAAGVFGDMFQLLDRDPSGRGEYSVSLSEEIKDYLKEIENIELCELRLPSNMYIWATMNSADQGVFPLDTAFKRRFDEYKLVRINDKENEIIGVVVDIKSGVGKIEWNKFRKALNRHLIDKFKVREDKLIGPFFIKPEILTNNKKFDSALKDKLFMYLAEDVLSYRKTEFFTSSSISEILSKYDNSEDIFKEEFWNGIEE